ncbi:hypothetical protein LRS12_12995 [Sphingomonas sp. J344]|nr:hypothetical protein [Sphingomonas sp. J344]MCR5871552.1 hypothetical protein [Sphingomonas sp. J344]
MSWSIGIGVAIVPAASWHGGAAAAGAGRVPSTSAIRISSRTIIPSH